MRLTSFEFKECFSVERTMFEKDSYTFLEIAREYFPDLDDSDLNCIIWEYTGFPNFFLDEDSENDFRKQLKEYEDYCKIRQICVKNHKKRPPLYENILTNCKDKQKYVDEFFKKYFKYL